MQSDLILGQEAGTIVLDLQQIQSLFTFIGELEKQINTTNQELQSVQKQLDSLTENKSSKHTYEETLQSLDKLKKLIQPIKRTLGAFADHAVQQGTRVICRAADLLKLKKNLSHLKEGIKRAENAVNKMIEVQKELKAICSHIENIGTVLIGKETEVAEMQPEQEAKAAEMQPKQKKEPFENYKKMLKQMGTKIDKWIVSIEQMENNLVCKEKSSVVDKLKQYQEQAQNQAVQESPILLAKKKEEIK